MTTSIIIASIISDILCSFGFPIFNASVLSMRYGKLKYVLIFSSVFFFVFTPITYLLPLPQFAIFFSGIGLMLAGAFIFSDDKPLKIVLYTLIPYAANIITSLIYMLLRTMLMPDYTIVFGAGDFLDYVATWPSIILSLFIMSILIRRKKPKISDLTIIYIITTILIQAIMLTFLMYVQTTEVNHNIFILTVVIYMVISVLLNLLVIRYIVRINREQSRREFIANQYDLLSSQYSELRSSYIGYRKLRHDLKDHIRVIRGLLQRGEAAELTKYADALTDEWESLSSKTFCDVPAVDIVLADKYSIASSGGITADFAVSGIRESGADSIYLCSIFSNLLNNALEAVRHCSEKPQITLRSGIAMSNLVITCRNSMPKSVPVKKDPHRHGYGLKIITELSGLLGGNFLYEHDQNFFTATVTIPVSNKEETADDTYSSDR